MFLSPRKEKYPSEKQLEIWYLNRSQKSGRSIAKQLNVSPAFVSKSLKQGNQRIKVLFENTARSNKIKLDLLDPELGFARGYSHMLDIKAYITFSPTNGIQVWYEDKGDCANCEVFKECRTALLQEFKERNISIANPTLAPTNLGDELFKKLEELSRDKK
ncbi:MAG: hypothetical protein ACW981_18735 [Candidatus Hodarchaeales archaeon]|jgi:hypothetical protein